MTNITPLDLDPNRRDPDRRLHLRGVPDDRSQRYQGIGTEFAAARVQSGVDVVQVATTLRIRKEHLAAIEEGRFGDLPAPAYALGFVRSYADYLGLDPAAAVEAFKQETSTSRRRTPLVFPTAEPVERVPRGWLLGMSAVLAAVVFGAWYYAERTGVSLVDRVPSPPVDRAVAAANPNTITGGNLGVIDVRAANAVTAPRIDPPAIPQTAPAAPAGQTLDPAIGRVLGVLPVTQPVQAAPPPAATAPRTTTPPAAATPPATPRAPAPNVAATPAPAIPAATPAPVETAVVTTPPAATPDVAAAPATPEAAREPEIAALDPVPSPTAPAPAEPVAVVEEFTPPAAAAAAVVAAEPLVTTPTILAPPAPQVAAAVAPPLPMVAPIVPPAAPVDLVLANREGQIFGATSGRVVVLAHQDSWVQITGAAGELLLTRILRAGDKYIAPAREDLVMMTGNAGALEVSVDGKVIPPLGPPGTVRRNVSLSAEKLLNGTAVQP